MTQEEFMQLCQLLDKRYMLKEECSEKSGGINLDVVSMGKDVKIIKWFLGIIATTAVSGIVTVFLALILK